MHVRFLRQAERHVFYFIKKYQEYLIKDFFDTGLIAEEQIRENYINQGEELGRAIFFHIRDRLSQDIIPYEPIDEERRLIVSKLDKRLLFIEYREQWDMRIVQGIKIFYR